MTTKAVVRDEEETSIYAAVREQLPDQYILSESINMYRPNNTSKSMHIAVQNMAMLCAFIRIDPIKIFEDPCAIIGYSIRCPIVGAMYVDCNNIIDFNISSTSCHSLAYCFGQYVLSQPL